MSDEVDGVEFRLLGPVGIWRDGRSLGPARAHLRAVLAMLLLDAGQVVSIDAVMTALWDEDPPPSARNAVHGYVSRLRRILTAVPGAELSTSVRGYLLAVDRSLVDLHRFRDLVAKARASDAASAGDLLRTALSLWRGPALVDVTSGWLATVHGATLNDERLAALDERAAIDLRAGVHDEVVADLSAVVAEHPLRERSVGLLMTALHRSGRRADAMALFSATRRRLVEELGIEPGEELQRAYREILESTPTPTAPALAPRQLPADTAAFTGRESDLAALHALLPAAGESTPTATICVLSGTAGVGKTALAVRFGRQVRDRFPDGQLFLDLRGFHTGAPMPPAEALPLLLTALGLAAEQIPVNLHAQTTLYRSALADRRVLLILDNVVDPDQVRPLLPGDPGCLALVTSRDRLSGLVALDGAHRVTLDVLPAADAVDVLAHAAGRQRVDADPDAAAELAGLCGHLPLALRVAGARLADWPHLHIRVLVKELAARGPMTHLHVDGDGTVRGAFDLSYQALPTAAKTVFRLLGLLASPAGTATAAVAALRGLPTDRIEPLVDVLARLHLVNVTAEGRLVCHDLLLRYAAELTAAHDPPAERDAAIDRLLHFYLHTADRAATTLIGQPRLRLPRDPLPAGVATVEFAEPAAAREWIAAEWSNLITALDATAASGRDRIGWQLAAALRAFTQMQAPPVQGLHIAQTGLAAAQRAGYVHGEIAMRLSLGFQRWRTADYQAMLAESETAALLSRRAGWRQGRSAALCNTGIALAQLGQPRRAISRFTRALVVNREIGDRVGEANILNNLTVACEEVGDLARAAEFAELALPLLREIGQRQEEAIATENLAVVRRHQGRLADALDAIGRSLAISRAIGARREEASALNTLGLVHHDAGRNDEAVAALAASLEITRQSSDSRLESFARTGLATIQIRQGRCEEAAASLDLALEITHQTGHHRGKVEALLALSELRIEQGDHHRAQHHATAALSLARPSGHALATAQAHSRLATASLGMGDLTGCLEHCRRALNAQRRAGQRLAHARTLLTMGRAYHGMGKPHLATAQWRRAHAQLTEIGAPEHREAAALLESPRTVPVGSRR
ncbi:tetratricopeptide repeat protein [Micromonospora sp. KC606]|uniref:AfsR/SARP family transcriptional regulator n=1 Tax=Micromonospora sp. KC606 TaxID=2530379 RepID=UPI001049C509|nr:BTAD domain-containing putative transcriptional regulator [Micromonospora sp. KC606]TDC80869.1 tetratricopeptide repeat protein [Micromonospora sp. KC606]